ncbi:MAG: FAD-binding oxidoreductase [Planctomycetota bacterium]|nr:MAG: FAD-binding oxidoreductase [Planctomycetota bacterium]
MSLQAQRTPTSRARLLDELAAIVGTDAVLHEREELLVYASDGSSMHAAQPAAVVLPSNTEQVQAVVLTCRRHGQPFVARGAGTGLSGGALALGKSVLRDAATPSAPHASASGPGQHDAPTQPAHDAPTQPAHHAPTQPAHHAPTQPAHHAPTQPAHDAAPDGGVIIGLNRMNRILSLEPEDRLARCEPGVANLAVSAAAAAHGLYYAPDPSSQSVCTLGGNVAHNSGGPHTLTHGVTVNHVRGLELITPEGERVQIGGAERPGYDLTALLVGSEGTLGIVTRVDVNLVRLPESVRTALVAFPEVETACGAVSALIAAGIVPAALELLDAQVVEALSAAFGFEFPPGAGALLLLEMDGPEPGMDADFDQATALCREHGALQLTLAVDPTERAAVWRARKLAFGALGRICANYYTQDGVIPRSLLPQMLAHVRGVAERYGLRIANVFHAGDGNLHPCILFDHDDEETRRRAVRAGGEILRRCVELGGSLTGEHGVGVEKREWMGLLFDPDDLAAMARLRAAFDPEGLCNPGKLLPLGQGCGEARQRAGRSS